MKLTFVRHTSVNVPSGMCYGWSDVDVSSTFEQEAKAVKSKLSSFHYDKVYCSPLQRCRLLADYCGYPHYETHTSLMEMNFGDWEMQYWDRISDPHLQAWFDNWTVETPTNGQSFQQLVSNVERFLETLVQKGIENVLIFTHAGVIRAFHVIINNIDLHQAFDLKVNYGDVFEWDVDR